MILFRATVLDTPTTPFARSVLPSHDDRGLLVQDGVIMTRGVSEELHSEREGEPVVDAHEGLLLTGWSTRTSASPGASSAARGVPLLEWPDQCALHKQMRLADVDHARGAVHDFVTGMVYAGAPTVLRFALRGLRGDVRAAAGQSCGSRPGS